MEAIENSYLKQTEHNIADDYRDLIRGWFKKWYKVKEIFMYLFDSRF